MAQLFGRAARIVLGSQLFEGLRVQFKVKKTDQKEPNSCELTIFNLSQQSRAKLQGKGTRLIIEAGYGSTIAQIFSGDSTIIDHVQEGANWMTKILCADGERAYRFSTVSESFKAGTPLSAVFQKCAQATGLDVTAAIATVQANVKEQFTQGYSASGNAMAELAKLLKGRGHVMSIQDGRLQVLKEGTGPGTMTSEPQVLLNKSSGLIGSPEHGTADAEKKAQVLKMKSLLQPDLRPGRGVRVESRAFPAPGASFRVQTVTHEGDTDGGPWYSNIEAVPV